MTRITLVHQAALGDTVLLLPLIRSLRQRFGEVALTLVSRTDLGQMLALLGLIEGHASADDRDHTLWFAPPADSHPNSLPTWADADYLIGAVAGPTDPWAANARLARPDHPPATLLFFHPRPPPDFRAHVTAWHRHQLASIQLLEAPPPLPRVNPDGPVVIHPGSGGDAKCWPRDRYLALGRALKRNGIVPTFVLGEVEQDRWGTAVIDSLKDEFPWYLHMGLYELAEKLSRARLFLGNDSGVTHLAAAVGIPTLAVFGPSNDTQWRPSARPSESSALPRLTAATWKLSTFPRSCATCWSNGTRFRFKPLASSGHPPYNLSNSDQELPCASTTPSPTRSTPSPPSPPAPTPPTPSPVPPSECTPAAPPSTTTPTSVTSAPSSSPTSSAATSNSAAAPSNTS